VELSWKVLDFEVVIFASRGFAKKTTENNELNYPMFEYINIQNLLKQIETRTIEKNTEKLLSYLPAGFEAIMGRIEDSHNYGKKLCDELIQEGNIEAAIRVDRAVLDTRLQTPDIITIARPYQKATVGSTRAWAQNFKMQDSHMREIYHRAAYNPEEYHKMTKAELVVTLFTLAEHGPLTAKQTDVLLWLCDQIPIGNDSWNHHPDVELHYKEIYREAKIKGRNKPSGERQWTKNL